MPPVGFEPTISAGERPKPTPQTARPLGLALPTTAGPNYLLHKTAGPNYLLYTTAGPNYLLHTTAGPNYLLHTTAGPNYLPHKTAGPNYLLYRTAGPNYLLHTTAGPNYLLHKTAGHDYLLNTTAGPNYYSYYFITLPNPLARQRIDLLLLPLYIHSFPPTFHLPYFIIDLYMYCLLLVPGQRSPRLVHR